jgi:hypothetical protein
MDGLESRIEPYRYASGASIVYSVMGECSSWVNYRTIRTVSSPFSCILQDQITGIKCPWQGILARFEEKSRSNIRALEPHSTDQGWSLKRREWADIDGVF